MDLSVRATVREIKNGHRGSFFIATCESIKGSITVSLKRGVWKEDQQPEPGTIVILNDIRKKRKGWRAYKARFLRPGDES